MDTRRTLYENIVLSGATTMFPGFASRFKNELENLYRTITLKNSESKVIKIKIKVKDSPRRKISVFIGAAVLAKTYNNPEGDCDSYWISKQEWNEIGKDCILKCPNILL
jgi:actin-related protein